MDPRIGNSQHGYDGLIDDRTRSTDGSRSSLGVKFPLETSPTSMGAPSSLVLNLLPSTSTPSPSTSSIAHLDSTIEPWLVSCSFCEWPISYSKYKIVQDVAKYNSLPKGNTQKYPQWPHLLHHQQTGTKKKHMINEPRFAVMNDFWIYSVSVLSIMHQSIGGYTDGTFQTMGR